MNKNWLNHLNFSRMADDVRTFIPLFRIAYYTSANFVLHFFSFKIYNNKVSCLFVCLWAWMKDIPKKNKHFVVAIKVNI